MIKNFAKITQWAGEKLGASHGTLPSDEFRDLQIETKKRHDNFEEMRHTMELAIQHIHKNKITSDNGRKRSPMGAYGESLVAHAGMFPRDSSYWNTLTSFGLGERRISEAEDRFADHLKDNYVVLLQQSSHSFKEYLTLCRKLESRRLDYDAKYNRLQKAKKESPDSEQSVQSAKVKYEETEVDVVQCMISLQETETGHCNALRSLLEAQLSYHQEAVKILENIKNGWDQWENKESGKLVSDGISNNPIDDGGGGGDNKENDGVIEEPRQRRALYDHIQDHDDELTFRVNDIITVLYEVDDAWWFGEIVDSSSNTSRGIFPVNYTESYTCRKFSNSSSISKEEADIAKLKDDIDHGRIIGLGDDNNSNGMTRSVKENSAETPTYIVSNDTNKQAKQQQQEEEETTKKPSSTVDVCSTISSQASSPLPDHSSSSLVPIPSNTIATTKRSSTQQPPPPPPHASPTMPIQRNNISPEATQQRSPIPPSMKQSNPNPAQNTSPTPTSKK